MVTKIQGMAEESELLFSSKKERLEMLEKVLKASDADADEEADFGGVFDSQQVSIVFLVHLLYEHLHTHAHTQSSSGMAVSRKSGSMASMSGGDDMMYLEVKKNKPKEQHPLFKMRR